MLKVLLVDDEIITISMLQSLIDWKKYNLELVGHADNGLTAVEMCIKFEPDIVISDIRMPTMTGIELIRRIKTINKDTAFILVTAYSDFSYISEAMKLGCSDYILKPIDENELADALKKIVEKVTGEMEKKEIIKQSEWQKRNYALQTFMKTGFGLNTVTNKKMDYTISFTNSRILMIQMDYKTIDEYANMQHIGTIKISYITHVIEEILKSYTHILFDYEEDSWVILLSDLTLEKLLALSENLRVHLKDQFDMNVVLCFSDTITLLEVLPHEYTKVKMLSRYSFYLGTQDILGYGYNCNENNFNQVRGFNLVKEMEEAIVENDRMKVERILNEIFYLSKNINPASLHLIYDICYQIILFIKNILVNKNNKTEEMERILKLNLDELKTYKSVVSFKNFMCETLATIMPRVGDKQTVYSEIVEQGIQIIRENFDKNVSLDTICKEISVSKNYFSYLFKREVGISVWSFLTELRLEKAKKLLKETTLKNYDISFQVGYENPSYFSMLFKNYESMTPSQFRKLNNK